MKDLDNLFPSYTISFNERKDFNLAIKMPEASRKIDVSWSERIINFEDKQDREDLISELAICGINSSSFVLSDD